jgi:ATP/maltotriose-dependent transcriptional regulator MalT
MATPMPVLVTKLFIPPPRPNLVPRPRLIERLSEGRHHKLVLISAPVGFGKTTLVSAWVSHDERPAARLGTVLAYSSGWTVAGNSPRLTDRPRRRAVSTEVWAEGD